jgi:hypothetical protein
MISTSFKLHGCFFFHLHLLPIRSQSTCPIIRASSYSTRIVYHPIQSILPPFSSHLRLASSACNTMLCFGLEFGPFFDSHLFPSPLNASNSIRSQSFFMHQHTHSNTHSNVRFMRRLQIRARSHAQHRCSESRDRSRAGSRDRCNDITTVLEAPDAVI